MKGRGDVETALLVFSIIKLLRLVLIPAMFLPYISYSLAVDVWTITWNNTKKIISIIGYLWLLFLVGKNKLIPNNFSLFYFRSI